VFETASILRTCCSLARKFFAAAEFFPIRKQELAGMTGVFSLTHDAENRSRDLEEERDGVDILID